MKIEGMPLNKVKCETCPFRGEGCPEVRSKVEQRVLTQASQVCHGTCNKTLCRGARDFQLQIFHRLGLLKEATDECWTETWEKLKKDQK